MKKLGWTLIILGTIVVCVGFYRGWFAVTTGRESLSHKVDVNLTLDPDKVRDDAGKVQDKVHKLTESQK